MTIYTDLDICLFINTYVLNLDLQNYNQKINHTNSQQLIH